MTFADPFNNTMEIVKAKKMTEDTKKLLAKYKKGQVTPLLILEKSNLRYGWLEKVVFGYANMVDKRVQGHDMGNSIMFFVGKNPEFVSVAGFKKWVNDCEESHFQLMV